MGVCIKWVKFRENVWALPGDQENCPYEQGVHIKWVSTMQVHLKTKLFKNGPTLYLSTNSKKCLQSCLLGVDNP